MSFTNSPRWSLLGAVVGALAYGCSSSDTTATADAGGNPDGATTDASTDGAPSDATPDAPGDAAVVCAPRDVSTFTPPPYVHARQVVGACTDTQITAYYVACWAIGHSAAKCDAARAMAPACADCLDPKSATVRGLIWRAPSGASFVDNAACMELFGGAEGLACAKAAQASLACYSAACGTNCPVTDNASFQTWGMCNQKVTSTAACKTYIDPAVACEQTLRTSDGGASVCLQASDFQGAYDATAKLFCGGTIADAGPG